MMATLPVSEAGVLLSSVSVLLGAYGFIATLVRGRLDEARAAPYAKATYAETRSKVNDARWLARALVAVPFVVSVLLLPTSVRLIDDAITDVHLDFPAVKAILLFVCLLWATLIAAVWWLEVRTLTNKYEALEKSHQADNRVATA